MQQTTLAGRTTSRLGFGCGRLVGGAGARDSRRLVETALELGIRHFDVAPSYGLGLAENVLGDALAGVPDVTIVTKAGIARPANAGLKSLARQVLRPLLSAAPGIKARLARQASGAARGQFAPEQVAASLADSLARLKRDRVDAFLLHQPTPADLTSGLEAAMARVVREGRAGAVGSGTNDDAAALVPFGTVRQHRFQADAPAAPTSSDGLILHGALRRYPAPATLSAQQRASMAALGRDPADPAVWAGLVLTLALASSPDAILLVSSTSPRRLRAAVEAVDWTLVASADADQLAVLESIVTG